MQNVNLTGWKEWTRKPVKKEELINWTAYEKGNSRLVMWDSSADFIECWRQNGENKSWQHPLSGRDSRSLWAYGEDYKTLENTLEALENGQILDKYIDKVGEAKSELFKHCPQLENLQTVAMSKRRRRKYAEEGAELDIDRYMCADPAMWVSCPPSEIRKRSARIYIDVWGTCGTTFQTFINSIVFAAAMADIIEAAGITLEIVVGTTATNFWEGKGACTIAFPVKQANEPMDISKLLTFGISGFLRGLCFDTYHGIDAENWDSSCGTLIYGGLEGAASLEPLEADIVMKGGDAYTNPDKVQMIVGKIKTLLNITD